MGKKTFNLTANSTTHTVQIAAEAPVSKPGASVFSFAGEGNIQSEIIFLGEARDPKADELLTKMIEAMGVKRQDVFISSSASKNVKTSKPKVIVALGKTR